MALAEITGREKVQGSYKGYWGVFSKFLFLMYRVELKDVVLECIEETAKFLMYRVELKVQDLRQILEQILSS